MKKKFLLLIIVFGFFANAQQKLFQNKIEINNLNLDNKLSNDLTSTFIKTDYYLQNQFYLNQDFLIYMPNNDLVKAIYKNSISYVSGGYSAIYIIENQENSQLVFSEYDNVITGMYQSENNSKYIFQQTGNGVFAVSEVNESSFTDKEKALDYVENYNKKTENKLMANSNVCLSTTPICSGNTTIDLMVVYTPRARGLWGSVALSNSNITTSITNMNVALTNSGITNISFRLVYVGEINYIESGSFSTDLSNLSGTSEGFLDEIHNMRITYGADLVGLVIGTPTSSCGLGYLNSNPTNYSNTAAFTVTLYSCAVSNFTIAHEFGHNMGLNHDWYVSSSTNPCAHHHGYVNQTAIANGMSSTNSQRWRTIMAYNNQCSDAGFSCTRINRWSNPESIYNTESTGVEIGFTNPADEAFGFRRFACVVSNFMPASLSNPDFDKRYFSVFPNPVNDFIEVNCEEETVKVTIVNLLGQTIITSNEKKINIENLSKGVYMLTVYDSKNINIGNKKIVKN